MSNGEHGKALLDHAKEIGGLEADVKTIFFRLDEIKNTAETRWEQYAEDRKADQKELMEYREKRDRQHAELKNICSSRQAPTPPDWKWNTIKYGSLIGGPCLLVFIITVALYDPDFAKQMILKLL